MTVIEEFIKKVKNEYMADLARVISFNSVTAEREDKYPFGKEAALCVEAFLELGEKYGFETENMDYYCGRITYKSENPKKEPVKEGFLNEIGFVGHSDIVPADEKKWSTPPFSLTEKDGLLLGRGMEDDKGPLVAALYAMRYLKEEYKKTLPFDVTLIIGSNEEAGMEDLPYYLSKRKAPFFSVTPDSNFPVCIGEKGITTVEVIIPDCLENVISFKGGTVKNAVAGDAYAILKDNVSLSSTDKVEVNGKELHGIGTTAHAAMPESGENAIGILSSFILENGLVFGKEKKAFEFLKKASFDYKGKVFGIDCSDEPSGYLTCVAGVTKTVGNDLVQTFNIRLPVTLEWNGVFEKLEKFVGERGYILKKGGFSKPYYISPHSYEIKTLLECYRSVSGDNSEPYTIGGGTYAKIFPNTYVYGATQYKYMSLLGEGKGGAHENDEYLTVKEFEDCIKVFSTLAIKLANDLK